MISFATQVAFELGMHRAKFYQDRRNSPVPIETLQNLFASVNDLEKRFSFFTNLPCVSHDRYIDEGVLDLVRGDLFH